MKLNSNHLITTTQNDRILLITARKQCYTVRHITSENNVSYNHNFNVLYIFECTLATEH